MAGTQIYPRADAETQWFADDWEGVRFEANCGTLHTTEGTSWPGYNGGASAPNLTARPDIVAKRLVWRQHFPIDMSSRALRNEDGGVQTNTLNTVQVELIGTCDPKHRKSWNGEGRLLAGRDYLYWPDAPDWALDGVADFMAWCEREHKIPLVGRSVWLPYPESFGATGVRMSFAEWRAFVGWCGHQHVPENSHGDPGNIPFTRILMMAKKGDVVMTFVQQGRALIEEARVVLWKAQQRNTGARRIAIAAGLRFLRMALAALPKK